MRRVTRSLGTSNILLAAAYYYLVTSNIAQGAGRRNPKIQNSYMLTGEVSLNTFQPSRDLSTRWHRRRLWNGSVNQYDRTRTYARLKCVLEFSSPPGEHVGLAQSYSGILLDEP